MLKYLWIIVASLCVLMTANLSIAAENDLKPSNHEEFDFPPPVAEKTPQGPTASKPADTPGPTTRPPDTANNTTNRADLRASAAQLRTQFDALKGILSHIAPSRDDLEKTMDSLITPDDVPNARPGPHWKISARGK